MSEEKNKKTEEKETKKKVDFQIKGVNIDRAEYEEIILSNSNHPDKDYYR